MGANSVKRMVLIEADKDLAACVTRFFSDRFDVCHVETLEEALATLRSQAAEFLFADIDSPSLEQTSVIEQIRCDYPQMNIIVSYLSPTTGEPWEQRFNDCVDVLVRKPYRVSEVDDAMRALNGKERARR